MPSLRLLTRQRTTTAMPMTSDGKDDKSIGTALTAERQPCKSQIADLS